MFGVVNFAVLPSRNVILPRPFSRSVACSTAKVLLSDVVHVISRSSINTGTAPRVASSLAVDLSLESRARVAASGQMSLKQPCFNDKSRMLVRFGASLVQSVVVIANNQDYPVGRVTGQLPSLLLFFLFLFCRGVTT